MNLCLNVTCIAAEEKLNIITVILRSGDEPLLTRPQMQRVLRAHRAHTAYAKYRETLDDSDDDDGPEDDDAWLFEDLKLLTQLYSRLRDREQIIALIFEVNYFLVVVVVSVADNRW